MNLELLEEEVQAGYINPRYNDENTLCLLNYSETCTFDRHWNEATSNSRGLIYALDSLEVVARPFPKFFSYTEVDLPNYAIQNKPTTVTSKMDGSMGTIYWDGTRWKVATRGSFNSDQAKWATDHLTDYINVNDKYAICSKFSYDFLDGPFVITPIVEIIYPENRIVVNYKGSEELVLIALINNETGADLNVYPEMWPYVVQEWKETQTLDEAYSLATSDTFQDDEGLVVAWFRYNQPSFRLKIKHHRYVELHRIMTGMSPRTIWTILKDGKDLSSYLVGVPEEFYDWAWGVATDLRKQYAANLAEATQVFTGIRAATIEAHGPEFSRRDFALKVPYWNSKWNRLAYAFLDDSQDKIEKAIWDSIKPAPGNSLFQQSGIADG